MQRINFTNINFQHILIFSAIVLAGVLGMYIGSNGASKLVIAGLLGAIFFVLTITRPWMAIAAFFALIPLENLFVLQGSITATLSKMMGAYLIFLVIVTGSLKYINEVFINKKVLLLMLYGGLAIVSVSLSQHKDYGIQLTISLWLSIILYFVLVIMVRDIKTLYYATWALLVGGIISIISPYFFGYGIVGGLELKRYGGLWGDQNEFASLLLILIPLAIMNFFTSRTLIYKAVSAFASVVLLAGLILTYSRGGFLALGAMVMLAMFKLITGKNRLRILAVAVPCLIIASVIFYHTFADEYIARMETLRNLGNRDAARVDASLNMRYFYYFELSPRIFAEHPIFGVGFREFTFHNPYNQVTHNTYLEVLTGMGVLGFLPFMAILFFTLKELWQVQKKSQNNDYLSLYAIALEIGFAGYLVSAFFLSLDINKMLWASIALSAVLWNLSRLQAKDNRFSDNKLRNPSYYK